MQIHSLISVFQQAELEISDKTPPSQIPNASSNSCPQHGDLRLSDPPSGQGAGSGARTRDRRVPTDLRRVPADLRADSQATVLPTPHITFANHARKIPLAIKMKRSAPRTRFRTNGGQDINIQFYLQSLRDAMNSN
ncbi:hypothetical protein PoB_007255200 [Plakobranchus ocellatus]|uniref:Uncharacterized protein n=1 Tax=Plakobranchus ocellatus TaxID=259542 RepID=A0AAV4DP68_9GAST|nr:hypothetical protein PoB_007255200 [Plakobranchus ocellatus]